MYLVKWANGNVTPVETYEEACKLILNMHPDTKFGCTQCWVEKDGMPELVAAIRKKTN